MKSHHSLSVTFGIQVTARPCWNYLYLARRVEKTDDAEAREALLHLIAAHSPMAWAHNNMLGEYDFSDEKLRDSVEILPLKSAA